MAIAGMSGAEVALALGVSKPRVRQMRAEGKLTPIAGSPPSAPRYEPAHVAQILNNRDVPSEAPRAHAQLRSHVETALAAFKLFGDGASLEEVMKELQIVPAQVRALHREWITPLNAGDRQAGIDEREARRLAARAREAHAKAARALDAEYAARSAELDRDLPKLKKRSFDFASKDRTKLRAERAARAKAKVLDP